MRTIIARNFLIVLVFTIASASAVYGQIVVRKPTPGPSPTPVQKIPIFRGDRGATIRQAGPRPMGTGVAPSPLSATQKNTILQTALKDYMIQSNLVATPFAVLTPRTPYIPDMAALHLTDASYFYTWQHNEVRFLSVNSEASIYVFPQKQGQWFMIDCSIEIPGSPNSPARKVTIKSGSNKTETWLQGSGHVQALLVTQSLQWYEVSLSASDPWIFYRCDVDAAN